MCRKTKPNQTVKIRPDATLTIPESLVEIQPEMGVPLLYMRTGILWCFYKFSHQ